MPNHSILLRMAVSALVCGLAAGCASDGSEGPRVDVLRKARSHYEMGVDHLSQGRNALAIRELDASLELKADDPWPHVALAEAYRRQQHRDEAEQHLLRALALDPEHQPARLNLSALYIEMERYEESLPHARRLAEDPTFPAPWRALTNLGWAQLQLGRTVEARKSLELALQFRPNYPVALLNLGTLEAQEGQRLEAIKRFRNVIEQRPGAFLESEAHYRIAEIMISLGNRGRALEHLETALARAPESEWGKRSEEYLDLLK